MMRIYYDCDGKVLDHVEGEFSFWPSPHLSFKEWKTSPPDEHGMVEILWTRCEGCGAEGSMKELNQINCLPHEPCKFCGLRGICKTDCGGILDLLQGDGVYLSGFSGPEGRVN